MYSCGKKNLKDRFAKINISFVGEGGKSDCIPRPRFFWKNHLHFDARGLAGPKNFGVFGDKVIITLGGEQYYFTFGGTFLKKAKEDKWWEITMPPYAKYPWTVDKIHKQVSLKKHKYNSIVGKIFSGPWVVLVKKSPKIKWGTVELSLVDRKTGKTKDVYKNVTRTNKGYFREYGDGFYIDKVDPATVTGPYTGIKRPYLWYGKKKINLESSDDTFCYVFHEEKKCIPDPGRKLFEVVETDTMRLFIDKDRMWVERFSKKGDVKEDGN